MIRKDGRVQIMDFGLAKLKGVSRLTKEGSTVGTAGYMSPEQVQGQDADHRSDMFSLGVALFELMTGQLPFKGIHETAIAYEIVNVDAPPMSSIKPDIDPALDAIILECLEKDPNERAQSAKQVSIDLKRFKRESSKSRISRITQARPVLQAASAQVNEPTEISKEPSKYRGSFIWIIASGFFFLATAVVSFLYFQEQPSERQTIRFFLPPPEKSSFNNSFWHNFAVSPDGRLVVFAASDSLGKKSLWVRPLNAMAALPLPGTEDGVQPFWSTDSRFIGFFAGGKLKKIDASGGPSLTLCDAPENRGGSWNNEGDIIFTPQYPGPLYRVSSAGGAPTQLTFLDTARHQISHRFPFFLPDGNHFLYYASAGQGGENAILIGSLDGKTQQLLAKAASFATYSSGHVVCLLEQTLMAQRFDESKLAFTGNAFPVAEDVASSSNLTGCAMFSVSTSGVLLYQQGVGGGNNQPVWYDRRGRQTGTLGEPGAFGHVRLSPDGRQVAASLFDVRAKNDDIWTYDLIRGIRTRFTFDPKADWLAVWSPNGDEIVFASGRKGQTDIYRRPANGVTPEEPILQTPADERPSDWSRDGKFIVYFSLGNPRTGTDIFVLPLSGDRKPMPFLQTEFNESNPRFSPDSRWIAYTSNESGRNEIYVKPFPGPGAKWQVSTEGGTLPRWRRDGREIYYLGPEGKMTAAEVNPNGPKFEVGEVQTLFQVRRRVGGGNDGYDVSADGQRFLVISAPEEKSSGVLNVVVNWDAELKKK